MTGTENPQGGTIQLRRGGREGRGAAEDAGTEGDG